MFKEGVRFLIWRSSLVPLSLRLVLFTHTPACNPHGSCSCFWIAVVEKSLSDGWGYTVRSQDNRSATSDQDKWWYIYIQRHESKCRRYRSRQEKDLCENRPWSYTVKFPLCNRADKSKEDLNKRQRYMYIDCYYTSGPLILLCCWLPFFADLGSLGNILAIRCRKGVQASPLVPRLFNSQHGTVGLHCCRSFGLCLFWANAIARGRAFLRMTLA